MTKISAASLVSSVTGSMKFPTGESGDLAATADQIGGYIVSGSFDSGFYYDKTSDFFILGNATNIQVGGHDSNFQVNKAGGAYIQITRFSNNVTPPELDFGKSRGGSIGTYTAVQSGDVLGQISYFGSDGSDLANVAAGISVFVDAAVAPNIVPTRFSFSTMDNAGAYNTLYHIKSTGECLFSSSSTPVNVVGASASVQINKAAGATMSLARFSANATPPAIYLAKSRGASIGSYSALSVNDYLGGIGFAGDDGTDLETLGAGINVKVGASVASNKIPGTMEFYTMNASASYAIRAYIRYDGMFFHNNEIVSDNDTAGLVLKSANGHYWRFTVDNSGVLSAGSDLGTSI